VIWNIAKKVKNKIRAIGTDEITKKKPPFSIKLFLS
jgi:hypothetical protein